jgi:hypothetical protein
MAESQICQRLRAANYFKENDMDHGEFVSKLAHNVGNEDFRGLLTERTEDWANERPNVQVVPLPAGREPTLNECCAFAAIVLNQAGLPIPPIIPFSDKTLVEIDGEQVDPLRLSRLYYQFCLNIREVEQSYPLERPWNPNDVPSYVWEFVLKNIEDAFHASYANTSLDVSATKSKESNYSNSKDADAKDIAKQLHRLKSGGEEWKSLQAYSDDMGGCRTTISNAVHSDEELRRWARVGEFKPASKPREERLNDVHLHALIQSSETDPALAAEALDSPDLDPNFVQLILLDECKSDEQRQEILATPPDGLKEMGRVILENADYSPDDSIGHKLRQVHQRKLESTCSR